MNPPKSFLPKKSSLPKKSPEPTYTPLAHGGDLGAARALFPDAPSPFIDLSTAINPHPYPIPALPPHNFSRLPDPASLAVLGRHAAALYGAASPAAVVAAPGTQVLMAMIANDIACRRPKARAAILRPTYAEHARLIALAGLKTVTVTKPDELDAVDLAVVVNPNNPDGRVLTKDALLAIAERQSVHGGCLVVDEAFGDIGSPADSLGPHVEGGNIIVLRSVGKFFGLAGVRLSFALAASRTAAQFRAQLGPWPVSGPALSVGTLALTDSAWIAETRKSLRVAATRLNALLATAHLKAVGGTDLFSLVESSEAQALFARLGEAGVYVRRFEEKPHWLRFGLPGDEDAWTRLANALKA